MNLIPTYDPQDEKVSFLYGGDRLWRDIESQSMIDFTTLYIAYGCPDWGERGGKRNGLCTFCALPNAVKDYREAFYTDGIMPSKDHVGIFQTNLKVALSRNKNLHTLGIFNGGSFLAMSQSLQTTLISSVVNTTKIKRIVIESRAELITEDRLKPLVDITTPTGVDLTIRVGVETQNDQLRMKVLRKGHSRKQLVTAVAVMKKYAVTSGGYVLLKPAPDKNIRKILQDPDATEDNVNQWCVREAIDTINYILGNGEDQLGMDEVYYCSTNVGPGTPLEKEWEQGDFTPATLWMVYAVLQSVQKRYNGRVHLLPFTDEPPFLAVSSNHNPQGIPQDLIGAEKCDLLFHKAFNVYRKNMDINDLVRIIHDQTCPCQPKWIKK